MKISLITAVLDRRELLSKCLETALNQRYRNVEFLLQDGGSTDGSIEVARSYQDLRLLIESRIDGGVYEALNHAIRRSSGDVIGFLHSDDYYPNEYILSSVADALSDPRLDGVYGDLNYVKENGAIIRHWRAGMYRSNSLRLGWMPPHPTLFLRRSIYDELGTFDTSFKISADYELILRFLSRKTLRLAYLPFVLVNMRVGGLSNKSITNILKKSSEDYRAIKEHNLSGIATLFLKNIRKTTQFIGT